MDGNYLKHGEHLHIIRRKKKWSLLLFSHL